jgi:hypothetical protein
MQALQGLRSTPKHPQFGSSYGDLNMAYGDENAENYSTAANRANFNYSAAQHGAQQGLALSGLQNMADARQQQNQLASGRLDAMRSALSALL